MSALDNNADDSDSSDGVPEIGLDALRPEALAALLSVKQAREAAAALVALERNVGVPRDMRAQSASALRAACALIASGLDDATAEAAAAGA